MGDNATDAALIGRVINGDRSAASELIDRYGAALLGMLRGALGSKADADDAYQATWMRVIRFADSYDPDQPLLPVHPEDREYLWRFRIARFFRRSRKSTAVPG